MTGDMMGFLIVLVLIAIAPVSFGIWGLAGFVKGRFEARDARARIALEIQRSKEQEAKANLRAIELQYGLPQVDLGAQKGDVS